MFSDAEEKVEDEDKVTEDGSLDDDNMLLFDLATKNNVNRALPDGAMAVASKIGMHWWDEVVGQMDKMPHISTIKYMASYNYIPIVMCINHNCIEAPESWHPVILNHVSITKWHAMDVHGALELEQFCMDSDNGLNNN